MYVCMYVCMYVRMYVRTYVCMYKYIQNHSANCFVWLSNVFSYFEITTRISDRVDKHKILVGKPLDDQGMRG
jgi:hypothetical protein